MLTDLTAREADREFLRKRQEAVDEAKTKKFAVVGFALANAERLVALAWDGMRE